MPPLEKGEDSGSPLCKRGGRGDFKVTHVHKKLDRDRNLKYLTEYQIRF